MFKPLDINDKQEGQSVTVPETERMKCLIIGSGPAGYTAAVYAARSNLKPVVYEGLQPGGQLTTTTEVENYPGYPEGITGPVMMEDFKKQAERFGTDVRRGMAVKADFSGSIHKVWTDDNKLIEAETVIIATGATAKYLGLEDETKYAGGEFLPAQPATAFSIAEGMWRLWEAATPPAKKLSTFPDCAIKCI